MKKIYTTALILLTAITAYSQVYYVAPGGAALLSTNINVPGSLTYAVANAVAGDTVWVKAGNYGALNLDFQNSGTTANPIQFIGYKNTVGDIDSSAIPTSIAAYTTGNYNADFPTLNGGNRAAAGIAIKVHAKHYLRIKNFHVLNYNIGVQCTGTLHTEIENIVGAYFGDINAGYDGNGIILGNVSNCTLKHCFIYNAAAEGISVSATGTGASTTNNLLRQCSVFCDDNSTGVKSATDYYIVLSSLYSATCSDNTIEYCHIERVGNLGHHGHGYVLIAYNFAYDSLSSTKNNIIRHCTSHNILELVLMRGPGTAYNHFTDLKSDFYGTLTIEAARDNIFDRIELNDPALGYWDRSGFVNSFRYMEPYYVPSYKFAARNNTFSNCLFKTSHSTLAVSYVHYMEDSAAYVYPVDSNKFVNCTFVQTDTSVVSYFINCERANHGNSFVNCIISGYKNYLTSYTTYPALFSYENCTIYGNGFTQNGMTNATFANCIFQDPQFVNPAANDFHLQATSPCIDAGKTVNLTDDFESNQRPCNNLYDIGAYEFQNCLPTGISIVENKQDFTLYPNPANNSVTIFRNGQQDKFEITIYTLQGKEIAKYQNQNNIDISGLSNGLYFVTLKTADKQYTQKLIKN